jgi:hypothetical protein
MYLSSAADTFDDAISKGATKDQAVKASGMEGGSCCGARLDPAWHGHLSDQTDSSGLRGWAAVKLAQAGLNGVTFATTGAAQQYLTTEIEKAYYDPNATPDYKGLYWQALMGGILGAVHPLRTTAEERAARPPSWLEQLQPGGPGWVREGEVIPPPPPPPGGEARQGPTIEGEVVRPGITQEAQRILPGPEAEQAMADIRAAEPAPPPRARGEFPTPPPRPGIAQEARRALPPSEA